jgi:hypothetical protein
MTLSAQGESGEHFIESAQGGSGQNSSDYQENQERENS